MATRIENSRTPKRVQGTATWSTAGAAFTASTGKIPRLDQRGFPNNRSVDITAVTLITVA